MPQHPLPFILLESLNLEPAPAWRDEHTGDDPLPAPVETNASGITFVRTTRVTEVKPETTDDR